MDIGIGLDPSLGLSLDDQAQMSRRAADLGTPAFGPRRAPDRTRFRCVLSAGPLPATQFPKD